MCSPCSKAVMESSLTGTFFSHSLSLSLQGSWAVRYVELLLSPLSTCAISTCAPLQQQGCLCSNPFPSPSIQQGGVCCPPRRDVLTHRNLPNICTSKLGVVVEERARISKGKKYIGSCFLGDLARSCIIKGPLKERNLHFELCNTDTLKEHCGICSCNHFRPVILCHLEKMGSFCLPPDACTP